MNMTILNAYYLDVTGLNFGHVATPKTATPPPATPPTAPAPNLANTVASNSKLSNKWTIDPDANRPNTVISYCFDETLNTTYQDWYWWWWTKWKEQVFVAINTDNAPAPISPPPSVSNPLQVVYYETSPSPHYAYINSSFLVFVAGRRLSYDYKNSSNVIQSYTQVRDNVTDKSNIINYLEPYSSTNPSIASTETTFFVKSPTSMFNDLICNQDKCFFTH
jgi:hypothetical protein